MQNLRELVVKYVAVREQRRLLEQQANDIKRGEEEDLKNRILLMMADAGIKTTNFEGLGRITRKESSYYEIKDIDLLARAMLTGMIQAGQEGRPFADALLLQRRLSKEMVDDFLANNDTTLEAIGLAAAGKHDISITKN